MPLLSSRRFVLALAAVGALLPIHHARAELPPQYTVWNDFAAITAMHDIPEKLGVVDRIERTNGGQYFVHGGKCAVRVTVIRESARGADGKPIPGPSRVSRVDVGDKHCN